MLVSINTINLATHTLTKSRKHTPNYQVAPIEPCLVSYFSSSFRWWLWLDQLMVTTLYYIKYIYHSNSVYNWPNITMEFSGLTPCGSTPTAPNWKNQMESTEESQRELGRMGLECNTEGYTGGSGSGSVSAASAVFGLFLLLFMIFGVAAGIWCVCVQRQKTINAANINNFPG